MRAEVVRTINSRWQSASRGRYHGGWRPVAVHSATSGFRPFSQRLRGRLSCPARLLAAEMLTVSELQCQASLCSCMTALQMFMDWHLAM